MHIIGARVKHKTLDLGTVKAVERGRITVQFDDFRRLSQFAYPQAIDDGLLIVEDIREAYPENVSIRPVNIGRRTWNSDEQGNYETEAEKFRRSLNKTHRRRNAD